MNYESVLSITKTLTLNTRGIQAIIFAAFLMCASLGVMMGAGIQAGGTDVSTVSEAKDEIWSVENEVAEDVPENSYSALTYEFFSKPIIVGALIITNAGISLGYSYPWLATGMEYWVPVVAVGTVAISLSRSLKELMGAIA